MMYWKAEGFQMELGEAKEDKKRGKELHIIKIHTCIQFPENKLKIIFRKYGLKNMTKIIDKMYINIQ